MRRGARGEGEGRMKPLPTQGRGNSIENSEHATEVESDSTGSSDTPPAPVRRCGVVRPNAGPGSLRLDGLEQLNWREGLVQCAVPDWLYEWPDWSVWRSWPGSKRRSTGVL